MKNQMAREAISTTIGLGAFLGLGLASVPILISGASAVGLYLGTKLLLSDESNSAKLLALPEEIQTSLADCQQALTNIKNKQRRITNSEVTKKVSEIIALADKIITIFSENTGSQNKILELEKLLGSINTILDKYLDLTKHSAELEYRKMKQTLGRFTELLDVILEALKDYYKKGLKGDILDLDVEIKLLKNKIESNRSLDLEIE